MREVADEIDFLPGRLRVDRRQQQSRVLWLGAFACCALGLGVACVLQFSARSRLNADLELAAAAYNTAQTELQKLTRLQGELNALHDEASLLTYLRHPWPRTQIIAALLTPLPDGVTLKELRISREAPPQDSNAAYRPENKPPEATPQQDKRTLARRDLDRLRTAVDPQLVVVMIDGGTTDSDALHRYLRVLGQAPLFTSVELGSLGAGEQTGGPIHFSVRLVVRPGYGQPNGPRSNEPQSSPAAGNALAVGGS